MKGLTHERHSRRVEWYTPRLLIDAIGLEFDVDPCAPDPPHTAWVPAKRNITREQDGLRSDWGGGCAFVNWPYDNSDAWVMRLLEHHLNVGGTAITLSFARTETDWCQRLMRCADVVLFLNKRVRFHPNGGPVGRSSPGAGSILCAFGRDERAALTSMANRGLGLEMRQLRG